MVWERLYWTELQVVLAARECCELPLWKGSLLRGAFGRRLRRRVGQPVLAGGHEQFSEPDVFPQLWVSTEGERGTALKPLVLLPPETHGDRRTWFEPGDQLTFGVRMLGESGVFAAEVAAALGGNWWLGARRYGWETARVSAGELSTTGVRFHQATELEVWPTVSGGALVSLLPARSECTLRFVVPLDLKYNRSRIEQPAGKVIARRAVDRVADVVDHFCGGMERSEVSEAVGFAEAVRTGRSHLRRESWERYSSTVETTHPLTGLLGDVEVQDIPAAVWPYLVLAQFLHLGKGASFGQGANQIR